MTAVLKYVCLRALSIDYLTITVVTKQPTVTANINEVVTEIGDRRTKIEHRRFNGLWSQKAWIGV